MGDPWSLLFKFIDSSNFLAKKFLDRKGRFNPVLYY
jgi:hypothetical protein